MEDVKFVPAIRKDKINKVGTVPIVIKVYLNNKEVAHPGIRKKRIKPVEWDESSRCVKASNSNYKLLNGLIHNQVNQYENFVLKRQTIGLPVNKEILLKYLSVGTVENFSVIATDIINTRTLKDGKGLNEDTKRRYLDEINRLSLFKEHLSFNEITPNFLLSYKLWMQNDYRKKDGKPLDKNSIWKALGVIRMVYNEAVSREIITGEGNPFKTFKVGSYEQDLSKIKYLDLPQIETLEKVLNERQMQSLTYRIGWRFLSMCVCGMRISDAMALDEMYMNDAGDLEFKPYKTRRHENIAQIPISTERQKRYIQKTLSLPIAYTTHKSFRSTFNIHLKILAAMAGININLTSHAGRHTMGSFLVDAGVETKAAMKILGIKDEEVIKTYLHLKQSKLRSEADKLGGVM